MPRDRCWGWSMTYQPMRASGSARSSARQGNTSVEVGVVGGGDGDPGALVGEVDGSDLVGAVGKSAPVGPPASGEGGVAAGELVEGDLEFAGEEPCSLEGGLRIAGLVAADLPGVDAEDFRKVVDADAELGASTTDDVRGSH